MCFVLSVVLGALGVGTAGAWSFDDPPNSGCNNPTLSFDVSDYRARVSSGHASATSITVQGLAPPTHSMTLEIDGIEVDSTSGSGWYTLTFTPGQRFANQSRWVPLTVVIDPADQVTHTFYKDQPIITSTTVTEVPPFECELGLVYVTSNPYMFDVIIEIDEAATAQQRSVPGGDEPEVQEEPVAEPEPLAVIDVDRSPVAAIDAGIPDPVLRDPDPLPWRFPAVRWSPPAEDQDTTGDAGRGTVGRSIESALAQPVLRDVWQLRSFDLVPVIAPVQTCMETFHGKEQKAHACLPAR